MADVSDELFGDGAQANDILGNVDFDEDQDVEDEVVDAPNVGLPQETAAKDAVFPTPSGVGYRLDSRRIDLRQQLSVESDVLGRRQLSREISQYEEEVVPEEAIVKSKRGRKKQRNVVVKINEVVSKAKSLLNRMETAAVRDNMSNADRQPAIEKLKMLEEVEEACIHREMQPVLLNEGLLGVLKSWIEPLSDGTLPNIKIRTTVLKILQKLPIDTGETLDRKNLKSSQIGSRVMFLSRISDETHENRRMASELVQRWSRPIFEEARRDDEEEKIQYALSARKRRMEAERKEEEKRKTLKPGDPDFRYVANRPQPNRDYVIKPKSRIDTAAISGSKKNPVMQQLSRLKRSQKR